MRTLSVLILGISTVFLLQSCRRKNAGETMGKNDSTFTVYSEFYDFESLSDSRASSEKPASGKMNAVVNDKIEYGFGFQKRFKDISSYASIDEVRVSFKCWMDKKYPDATFVISVVDSAETKNLMWEGKPIVCAKDGAWSDVSYSFKMNPAFMQPESVLKLYVWNKGKNKFYYDDLGFEFVKSKK